MFPALSRAGEDGRPAVFVDAPGGSQVPDTVIDAVTGHYRRGLSNTHGAFATSRETDGIIADARRAAADQTGADPDEIVFGPNATTLLLHLSRSFAKTLEPGDEVVVTRLDHDANVRPWVLAAADAGATVRWVDVREDDVTIDIGSFEAALSPRTKLVAFTLASNAVGTIPPAADLVARAKEVGAVVAVDAVHLAQHRLLDLHGLGADLLACSPYKFFGPHLGLGAVRKDVLEAWRPYKVRPAADEPIGVSFETGTLAHELLAGFVAAVEYIHDLGWNAIQAHERAFGQRFLDGLPGSCELYGLESMDSRVPTFAFRVDGVAPREVAERLAARGIAVWDGDYYAVEVMTRLGLQPEGAVRAGFVHYNTFEEVDRLLAALADV